MGWGKAIADFGKFYLNQRGIDGALEDASKLKDGVQKLFGSNSSADDEYDETYHDDGELTIESIKSCIAERDYEGALSDLQDFYERHNKNADFWYAYWYAIIVERQWEDAWVDEVYDESKRVVNLDNYIGSMEHDISERLDGLIEGAEGKDEVDAAEGLFNYFHEMVGQQEKALIANKAWREIDKLIDPHKIVSGSKFFDYSNAVNRVNSKIYSYDEHETLDYNRDLYKVYSSMIRAALQDDTLFEDVKSHFNEVKHEMNSLVSNLKNIKTDDDDEKGEAMRLASKATSLLNKLIDKKNSTSSHSSPEIAKDKENKTQNVENEQEYLEEIKACLAGDSEISQRERRLLDRLRDSLGISEQRARELEASLSQWLTDDEKEYVEALKDSLVDGNISNRERRLLDKLRASLGISEARAAELEKHLS